METAELRDWFDGYLRTFSSCGRGDTEDPAALLDFYGVPFLLTTDQGVFGLTTREQVVTAARQQVDSMRAEGYDHTQVLDLDISPLNSVSALCRGSFSRRRDDDSEIGRLEVTYLITEGPGGRRISALAVHAA